ncbi:hypothetical protein G6027_08705 [Dietzia sp. SLG310A2-38A2]|uniref:hypothetical protein n=1 Tax=Dietzia sp. SLG310A2-38A2 TaxID=1630643 RepID=UPI0015FC89BF|nr:hypothetical protein [Dietzia sp. SLG310A2-38A2]MBB1030967.1 hypothetical protein [Dietzia sp. SLG310A2-38A2]
MSSLPGPRTCPGPGLRLVGIAVLATGAVAAALVPGMVALGASMGGVVGSAEMAAGAVLQARSGWMAPAVFTVTVFALVVVVTAVLLRAPVSLTAIRRARPARRERTGRQGRTEFGLRQPERALRVRIDRLPGITD